MMDVTTCSEKETIALGAALGRVLADGDVLALQGDLGAGKTHFVQGIAKGMGIHANVVSPTFTILNYYENDIPLQHFDFYRLGSAEEWEDAGFREIFTNTGLRMVEWPGQLPADFLPYDLRLVWHMDASGNRQVSLQAGSATGLQLLRNLEHER